MNVSNAWAWCILISIPLAFAPMLFIDGPLSGMVSGGGVIGVLLYVYALGLPETLLPTWVFALLSVRLFQKMLGSKSR